MLYIQDPEGIDKKLQRDSINTITALDKKRYQAVQDPEILTQISQYELAFKMQSSVPDLVDMSKEPAHVLEAYGAKPGDGSFSSNCLLARKLAERGVRFVQLYLVPLREFDAASFARFNAQYNTAKFASNDFGKPGMDKYAVKARTRQPGSSELSVEESAEGHRISGELRIEGPEPSLAEIVSWPKRMTLET